MHHCYYGIHKKLYTGTFNITNKKFNIWWCIATGLSRPSSPNENKQAETHAKYNWHSITIRWCQIAHLFHLHLIIINFIIKVQITEWFNKDMSGRLCSKQSVCLIRAADLFSTIITSSMIPLYYPAWL